MIPVLNLSPDDELFQFSNPKLAQHKLREYLDDKNAILYKSTNKNKKYMILVNGHKVHFGQIGFADFTKHNDEQRRQNYLMRTENIRGDWKDQNGLSPFALRLSLKNKYSPNNLSRNVLW